MSQTQDGELPRSTAETIRIFGEVAFRAPGEILEPLWSPAEAAARFRDFSRENAREFFLYKVLLDVQKVGAAMLRWADALQEVKEPSNPVAQIQLEARIAEHYLWQRRLVEMLALLVGFASTNEPIFYFHYLLLREQEALRHTQREQERYFGSRSAWTDQQIAAGSAAVSSLVAAPGFDVSRCWYLHQSRLASMAHVIAIALEHASPMERRSLGYCYGIGYSAPSEGIHFDPLSKADLRLGTLEFSSLQSIFLCATVITRVQELLGEVRDGIGCQWARHAAHTPTSNGLRGRVTTGDFVAVILRDQPYCAEVTGVTTSRYGNESYEVEFLREQPEGLARDSLLPRFVVPRLLRAGMADEVRAVMRECKFPEEQIAALSDEDIHPHIRTAALRFWDVAGRDLTMREIASFRRG